MSKSLTRFWPLILLLILTFVLRVISLEKLFYFTYDEAIPAFVGRRLILWQHIPLIGGVTPFGFHLAPYFYWFYSVLLFIGNLNPVIWGIAGAAISVATTFLIYKVGEAFGNKKVGLTAAVFWTFSFLANLYDRHLWALFWGPLFSLITLFSLYKIIKGSANYVYLLGVTLALAIHADPSNSIFVILAAVVWLIYKLPIGKSTLIAFGIMVLSFLPLVVFDLRHNFANTKPVFDFVKQGKNTPGFEIQKFTDNLLLFPRSFTRSIYVFGDDQIAKQYSYCRNYVSEKMNAIPTSLVFLASVILITFTHKYLKKNKQNPGWHLVSLLVLLYFLGIQVYGTIFRADIFEHYITGLFAAFLLILAKVVSLLPKKAWLVALGIFVFINLYKLSNAQNSTGMKAKRLAIEYTMQRVGDRPFSLDSLSTCWKLSGYRYLFAAFGREPVKSYVDPNLAYLYGETLVAEKHPKTVVTFVIHDFAEETQEFYNRYAILKSHEITNALFGRIEVVILDNSSGWFDSR